MFIKNVVTDFPFETGDGQIVSEPTLEKVIDLVRSLNARDRTMVRLEGADGPESSEKNYMAIGGGAGRCLVYFTLDSLVFMNLTSGSGSSDLRVQLVVGGQLCDIESRYIVSTDDAVAAAVAFSEDGRLDSSLSWERQE